MKIETLRITIDRIECPILYLSCAALRFGDYDSSCHVERANIRVLLDRAGESVLHVLASALDRDYEVLDQLVLAKSQPTAHICIHVRGDFGYEQIFLAPTPENIEILQRLDQYPAIDDEAVSKMKQEMIEQAWVDYGGHDVWSRFAEPDEKLVPDEVWNRYMSWCERTNNYPEIEAGGSVYFPVPTKIEEEKIV